MIKVKNNFFVKTVAITMCLIMVIVCVPMLNTNIKAGSTLEDLQQQADKLEQQIKDTEKKLQNANNNISNAKDKAKLLSTKRELIRDQLDIFNQKIVEINSQIDKKKKEIDTKKAEIDVKLKEISETEDAFSKRVGVIYKANKSNSTLKALLSSSSFSDFLRNAEMLRRVSESDNKLISTLKEQRKSLEAQKTELDAQKAELDKQKKDLSGTKATYKARETELSGLYNANASDLSEYEKQQKEFLANKEKYIAQNEKLEKMIEQAIKDSQDQGAGEGTGTMVWPVPSTHRITTEFGVMYSPWGTYVKEHNGLDISKGPSKRGDTILATDSGIVTRVDTGKSEYNPGGGYGNCVAIDHGNGISTLYGHLNTVEVKLGQKVEKGQRIGGMGTTGNSTGVHLHFGVMKNGKWVNPHSYVGY